MDAVRAARPAVQALRGDLQPAAVAAWRRHANTTRREARLTITSLHAKQSAIQAILINLAGFLRTLKTTAAQWTEAERLRAILIRAFAKFINSGPSDLVDLKNCPDMTR